MTLGEEGHLQIVTLLIFSPTVFYTHLVYGSKLNGLQFNTGSILDLHYRTRHFSLLAKSFS